jgi:type II secretory ATPase GspE/PulE/Tfp pilus assembly ATPase PilB-like protein
MGFTERNLEAFRKVIRAPYGIVLVVGPTGSGKTTTLHSALAAINTPDIKILTVEDPVEIIQPGLRQVQAHAKIGLSFADTLRAFLRSDPDVIMVGELRDHETADVGVEASLTGHLVLATAQANSAPETITRVLEMNVDAASFADALRGILAQRLVRTICEGCKEAYTPAADEWAELASAYGRDAFAELVPLRPEDATLYRGRGCSQCAGTGYRGRAAIHELLLGSERVKHLVRRRAPVDELRDVAKAEGMRTLMQDGIVKCLWGVTDFTQVRSVCLA